MNVRVKKLLRSAVVCIGARINICLPLRAVTLAILLIPAHTYADGGLDSGSGLAQTEKPNVLIINSYDQTRPVVGRYIDSLISSLQGRGWTSAQIHVEHLNIDRLRGTKLWRAKITHLQGVLNLVKPSIVVAVQQPAVTVLQKDLLHELKASTLLMLNAEAPADLALHFEKAYVQFQAPDYAQTLEQALQLFPKTKHIYVIAGVDAQGRLSRQAMEAAAAKVAAPLTFEYSSKESIEGTLARVRELAPDTLIFLGHLNRDGAGKRLSSYEANGEIIASANAPVFTTFMMRLGSGVIGGEVRDPLALAEQAAGVIAGSGRVAHTSETHVVTLPPLSAPVYDWKQLVRWGADLDKIPQGAIVLNRPPSLWRDHQTAVIGVASLIVVLTVLSASLALQTRRRADSERRYRKEASHRQAILDAVLDGILTVGPKGEIRSANASMLSRTEATQEQLVGVPAERIIKALPASRFVEPGVSVIDMSCLAGSPLRTYAQTLGGKEFPVILSVSKIEQSKDTEFVVVVKDETDLQAANERAVQLERFDALTGLANRGAFLHDLEEALTCDSDKRAVAAVEIDLANFKGINSFSGEGGGDVILVRLANLLKKTAPTGSILARIGSDEFGVILRRQQMVGDDIEAIVRKFCEGLLESIGNWPRPGDGGHKVSAYIGAAVLEREFVSLADVMMRLETATVKARSAGPGNFAFYSPEFMTALKLAGAIESELGQALECNQLFLMYQPKLNAKMDVVGMEALVRWFHPRWGLVPPSQFIPIAERSMLILDLGRSVVSDACQTLRDWQHVPARSRTEVSVNVSALEFGAPRFEERLIEVIRSTEMNPSLLKLELTESIYQGDLKAVAQKMRRLNEYGVKFSIDDFGIGFSSLSYLRALPVDEIKIDRSFLADSGNDANSIAVVRAVIELGRELEISVVAEGVETYDQVEQLMRFGCTVFQGNYFSAPLDKASATKFSLPGRELL